MKKIFANFPLCGECSRRERREGLKDGEFYCAIARTFLPNGIVTNDTDATDCVRKNWYKSVTSGDSWGTNWEKNSKYGS